MKLFSYTNTQESREEKTNEFITILGFLSVAFKTW